jgi:ABC-2 type transport system ATP-binding protein
MEQKNNSQLSIINCQFLGKTYGKVEAIKDISFNVLPGELFGFIGPDGAGKTTLFRVLTTLLLPDTGTATINNWDVVKDYKDIRKNIGYMPGRFSLYQDLSVEENLTFFASVFGSSIEKNYDLIKDIYVQIEPFKKRPAGKLSGGMKQKLALCCALIHKPLVLVLDEPTTGVDAVSRKEFWEMLKNLKAKGITIIVATPYMDEASLCDKVALMQQGKILSIDTPSGIIEKFPKKLWGVRSSNMYQLKHDLDKFRDCASVHIFGQYIHVTRFSDTSETEDLTTFLKTLNHTEIEINRINPGIEDCFIDYMGEHSSQQTS